MKNKNPQVNLIAKPNTSLSNKTGSWRTYRPQVERQVCIGCSTCSKICPEGCIEMEDSKPEINYDYCKGCGLCIKECPVKAINKAKDY